KSSLCRFSIGLPAESRTITCTCTRFTRSLKVVPVSCMVTSCFAAPVSLGVCVSVGWPGAFSAGGLLWPAVPEESWERDTAAEVARSARSINRCRARRWVALKFMVSCTPSRDPSVEARHTLHAVLFMVEHLDYTLTLISVQAALRPAQWRSSALIGLPLVRSAAESLEAPGILRFHVPQHVAVSVGHAYTKKRLSR